MLSLLKLFVPVLMPSWDFFKQVDASPRIEWALLGPDQSAPLVWHPFRPPAANAGIWTLLRKLLWNPRWNETLFAHSCAERFAQAPTDHSMAHILGPVRADVLTQGIRQPEHTHLQVRLVFVARDGDALRRDVVHVFDRHPLDV